jgi:homeobox protein cut-like
VALNIAQEHSRAVQALNPLEKILLGLAGFVLGRRAARTVLVLYILALHVFVAFTLFEATVSSETLRHTGSEAVPRPPP